MAPVLLLGSSVYLSLAVVDSACFVLYEHKGAPRWLYCADPARGHGLTPGFSNRVTTTYTFPVTINPQGYRGDSWTYEARQRFLIAGDSFTFGEPLPVEKGFVYELSRLFPKTVRFYNCGVSSYGTAHVLETLRKECPIIRPTHIFYMYYLNNTRWDHIRPDATTVLDGYLVYRYSEDGRRLSDAEIRQKIRATLIKNNPGPLSYARLDHLRAFIRKQMEARRGPKSYMETADKEAYPTNAAEIAADHIRKMYSVAQSGQAAFTMIILPGYAETHYGFKEPGTERLLRQLGKTPFPILDLRQIATGQTIHRLARDAHYNEATTAWVAQQLALYIRKTYDIVSAN